VFTQIKITQILGAWVLGCIIFLLSLGGCGAVVRGIHGGATQFVHSPLFHQGRHGKLTQEERQWAEIAWKYFDNNYQDSTGLVNGSDTFAVASVWNIADTIAATIIAHEFELLDDYTFDLRISTLLSFLNTMPLSFGKLPNRHYHTQSWEMVNAGGQAQNTGWSAIDIGRLLIWLQILHSYAPQFGEYIDKAILRWHFCEVIDDCGRLYGSTDTGQWELFLYPEMPIGYRDYALMGYASWGFPITIEYDYDPNALVRLYDLDIPFSRHDPRRSGNYHPVVSMPYFLLGLEFNWDKPSDLWSSDKRHTDPHLSQVAQRLYQVQEQRYQRERIFTARSDYQRNSDPYFLYDTIYAAGFAWNTITPGGEFKPDLALVSLRAGFPMWALWKTRYTNQLMVLLKHLYDPERGWYEGRYEKTAAYERNLTATTNALVLQTLYYKTKGKLYQVPRPMTYAEIIRQDEFRRPPCYPPEREACPLPPHRQPWRPSS
jgi:hypothetical protein